MLCDLLTNRTKQKVAIVWRIRVAIFHIKWHKTYHSVLVSWRNAVCFAFFLQPAWSHENSNELLVSFVEIQTRRAWKTRQQGMGKRARQTGSGRDKGDFYIVPCGSSSCAVAATQYPVGSKERKRDFCSLLFSFLDLPKKTWRRNYATRRRGEKTRMKNKKWRHNEDFRLLFPLSFLYLFVCSWKVSLFSKAALILMDVHVWTTFFSPSSMHAVRTCQRRQRVVKEATQQHGKTKAQKAREKSHHQYRTDWLHWWQQLYKKVVATTRLSFCAFGGRRRRRRKRSKAATKAKPKSVRERASSSYTHM